MVWLNLMFGGVSAFAAATGAVIAWWALVSKNSPFSMALQSRRLDAALQLHRCAAELVTEIELARRRKQPSYGLARRLGFVIGDVTTEEDLARFRISLVDALSDAFWSAARNAQMCIPEYPASGVKDVMSDVKLWRDSYIAYNSGVPFVMAMNYGETSIGRQSRAKIEIASSPKEENTTDHFGAQIRGHYGAVSDALKKYLPAWMDS